MELRNGDIGFLSIRHDSATWSNALVVFFAGLITTTIVEGWVDFMTMPLSGRRFSVPWNADFNLHWIYSISAAFIAGSRARTGNEVSISAWAGIFGLIVYPLCTGDIRLATSLGVMNVISCVLVAQAIYFARKSLGWVSMRLADPYSSLTCVSCGYWLPGLAERRCPECGTPFGMQEPLT